jgi:hypothetical protein
LNRDRQPARQPAALSLDRSRLSSAADRPYAHAPAPATAPTAAQLGHQLGQTLRALDQPSGVAGLELKLRYKDREHGRER